MAARVREESVSREKNLPTSVLRRWLGCKLEGKKVFFLQRIRIWESAVCFRIPPPTLHDYSCHGRRLPPPVHQAEVVAGVAVAQPRQPERKILDADGQAVRGGGCDCAGAGGAVVGGQVAAVEGGRGRRGGGGGRGEGGGAAAAAAEPIKLTDLGKWMSLAFFFFRR